MAYMSSRSSFVFSFAAATALTACGSPGPGSTPDGATGPDGAGGADASSDVRTLDDCTTSIASDAPAFYKKYFKCVTVTTTATGVAIATDDLPPHKSYYWGASSPN